MASEAANIGANFSTYEGNAGLGGGSLGVLKIDTKPLEDLARYTMLYNKAEYDQRQKNADEMIAEIAKQTSININDLYGKDKEEFQKQFLEFNKYLNDFARTVPQTPQEKLKKQTEYLQKRQQINSDYLSGQARAIKYVKDKNEIENEKGLSDATKKELLSELDNKFNSTKISEQFTSVPRYDLVPITLPSPLTTDANIIQEGPNANVNDKLTYYNPRLNNGSAFGIISGIGKLYPSEKTPEGQTPEARQQRTIESEAKAWNDSANILNGILKNYLITDPATNKTTFDEQRFVDDNANNKTLMESYLALKGLDSYSREKYQQALSGRLSDRGFTFQLPANVTPDDFRYGFVDFTKPIDANQIINAGIYSHYLGDKSVKAVQQTDNELQRQRLSVEWANYGLAKEKLNKANTQSILGADAILREVSDAINLATPWTRTRGGKTEQVKQIADPNLLKEFGTIDKEGNVVNRPDVIFFDPKQNQLSIAYYKKQDKDTPEAEKTIDGYVRNNKGEIIVEREVPVNPTEWFGQIASRKFSADDKGAINNFVDQIYDKFGRNLDKLATGYKGGATTQGPETKTTESAQTVKPTTTIKKTKKGLPVFQ